MKGVARGIGYVGSRLTCNLKSSAYLADMQCKTKLSLLCSSSRANVPYSFQSVVVFFGPVKTITLSAVAIITILSSSIQHCCCE